jgi:hypothetical protein
MKGRKIGMTTKLLQWEAEMQLQEAATDGISEDVLQVCLDAIYGKNMFEVVDADEFKKKLIEGTSDPII